MTFEQMRCFLEVSYCRSFSQAARNLYMAQPNLTKSIAAMEKELGTRLFDRTTRHVALTEHGQELLSKAETLFMPFYRAYEDMQADIAADRATIHIGVARDERLPEAVIHLIRHRNLSARGARCLLSSDSHVGLTAGLQNRRYDLIISSDRNARTLVGAEHIQLRPFRMMLAVSIYHPLAARADLTPAELGNETIFFALSKGVASSAELAQSLYHRVGTMMNVKLVDTPSDALANVSICAGAALLPDLVDAEQYPDIRFLPFPDNRREPACQALIWRSEERDPAVLSLLRELRGLPEAGKQA